MSQSKLRKQRPQITPCAVLPSENSKTAIQKHPAARNTFSPGFEAAMLRLVGETEYRSEFVFDPLETYGLPFAQYVLAELKERPGKILVSRFNQIADAFLEYYSNDAKSTDILDREIAEVEANINRLAVPEDAFRQEEQMANRYMVAELKSLRAELAKKTARSGA